MTHKWDTWEQTPRKYGLYLHKTKATFAIAYPPKPNEHKWTIDTNQTRPHIFFRFIARVHIVQEGTGNFFFNKSLHNYELLEEADYTEIEEIKGEG